MEFFLILLNFNNKDNSVAATYNVCVGRIHIKKRIMLKGFLSHHSPFTHLIISLLVVVVSFMLTMFVGTVLALLFFDINIFTDLQAIDINSDSVNISVLKFLDPFPWDIFRQKNV